MNRNLITMMTLLFTFSCATLSEINLEGGTSQTKTTDPVMGSLDGLAKIKSCFRKVHNRGVPPERVVRDIISFVKSAPDAVFAVNDKYDVYSLVRPVLGPYESLKHRRAVMADVLIVLAGWESTWNYKQDRDMSANNTSACTEEAGIYQTSGDSSYFGADLKLLQNQKCSGWAGKTMCNKFIVCTKNDIGFAHEYTARLLRHTTKHHGPLLRGDVSKGLSKACVKEIEGVL